MITYFLAGVCIACLWSIALFVKQITENLTSIKVRLDDIGGSLENLDESIDKMTDDIASVMWGNDRDGYYVNTSQTTE